MVNLVMRIFLIFDAYLLVFALGYLGIATYKHNLIGWFLLLTAIAYGIGGPILLWINTKKEVLARQEIGDRSFWLILPGFLAVFYAPPLEYLYLPEVFPRTRWLEVVGLVLIVGSLLIHTWARMALKGLYSGHIRVTAGHTLVQNGPYRTIRHPAYAGFLLLGIGLTVGYSSLIGLVSIPFLLLPGFIFRIKVEERLLTEEFGEEYNRYVQRTKRLIPGVW
jgi:protein-S-isoprenylcysteine O-methyltransferase Ste14